MRTHSPMSSFWNISLRKVGGLRFLFLGRVTFMFCVSKREHADKATSKLVPKDLHDYEVIDLTPLSCSATKCTNCPKRETCVANLWR